MKEILLLGGGFAGVSAGLSLKKHLRKLDAKLTLLDEKSFHVFTPSLYEVATSEEPQKNIAIPFSNIFDSEVNLKIGKIEKIDVQNSAVNLHSGESLPFDYLLICLGSQTTYFGIPGLEEYSLPLKKLEEAVKIKDKILQVYKDKSSFGAPTKVFVGGGGFSGVELASELINYSDSLAKKSNQNLELLEISVIEGGDRLLNTLDQAVSNIAKARLEKFKVKLYLSSFIEKVTEKSILIKDGPMLDYDILIWTGGVGANSLASTSGLPVSKRGQIEVNNFLQVENHPNIFASGDIAAYTDPKTGKSAPGVAQVAQEQGEILGENLAALITGQKLKPYKLNHFGYIMPMKGKFATAELQSFHLKGFAAWVLQQIVFIRYLLSILPFIAAFKRWNMFEMELMKTPDYRESEIKNSFSGASPLEETKSP